jgi:predicted regulator of Ras-like GTPase activity (Roadblock/LC7/MglB family)
MTIPFLDLFKRTKARFSKHHVSDPPIVLHPIIPKKEGSLRLSKTVMPNTTKISSPADPFRVAAGSAPGRGRETPMPLTSTAEDLGKERSIALTLADVVGNLPQSSIKPAESFDANRVISLKAAEIEKGMASGRPTVSLAAIYEAAPEIFQQSVAATDLTQIPLPFDKVLQEFQSAQVRADQLSDQAVPQLDTPILKVTLEDTERFGMKLPQLQTSAKPPVKVEPATAKSIASAEPEAVEKKKHAMASRRPMSVTPPPSVPPPSGAESAASPTRIPFHLPPNGTGVPASERVPASSGPPVPSSPPKPTPPTRIPFKLTPPGPELRPKFTLVPGVEPAKPAVPAETAAPPAASAAPSQPAALIETTPTVNKDQATTIRLELNIVLRSVPAFQLSGPLPEIPRDVSIEFPLALIEPQLGGGRVAIVPQTFQAAIPEKYRDLFVVDSTETPVLLPLHEVLKNLPATALKMRQDQERDEAIDHFETPFSQEAKADARRFQAKGEESAKPAVVAGGVDTGSAKIPETQEQPASPPPATTLDVGSANIPEMQDRSGSTPPATTESAEKIQPAEEKNDAKEFLGRATSLPGVAACSITFADGLTVAGNLPPEIAADGLCAMAPSLLQKIEKHMLDTKLGSLNAITLQCAKSPLTFFMEGNVCLAVLHADGQLESNTQEKLTEMVKELSRVYTQPETTHVDH